MANLDDEIEFVAHHLAVELVRGGVSKRTIEAALKSLAKKEGDRRAEDMRERAATEADLHDVAIAATIRALPLEKK